MNYNLIAFNDIWILVDPSTVICLPGSYNMLMLQMTGREMLMIELYLERCHFPRAVDGVLSPRSERTSFPGVGGGQPGLGAHQRSSGRRGSGCRLAAGGGSFPTTIR